MCAGLQVPKPSCPVQCLPAPGSGRRSWAGLLGPSCAGGPGCPLPGTSWPARDLAPLTLHFQSAGNTVPLKPTRAHIHRLIAYCIWFCIWREGVLLDTFFFTPKIKFSVKSRSYFFLLSPLPQITSVFVLVISSFGAKSYFSFLLKAETTHRRKSKRREGVGPDLRRTLAWEKPFPMALFGADPLRRGSGGCPSSDNLFRLQCKFSCTGPK